MAETTRRGHATRLARGAAHSGFEAVISLGGDGTLNETANGLAGTTTMLGALPGGSTNVFARTLGFPNDPVEATAILLDAMAQRHATPTGLGSVNGRYFLFHVGIGFDAAVVEQVENRGSLKRWAGHPLFIYSTVDTWVRHYDRSKPHFNISIPPGPANSTDDAPQIVAGGFFSIAMNTDPYTFLGNRPLSLVPHTNTQNGLSLVTLKTLKFVPLMRTIALSLLRGGGLREGNWVDIRQGVTRATIVGPDPIPFQVDGDYLGALRHLELAYESDALNIITPLDS